MTANRKGRREINGIISRFAEAVDAWRAKYGETSTVSTTQILDECSAKLADRATTKADREERRRPLCDIKPLIWRKEPPDKPGETYLLRTPGLVLIAVTEFHNGKLCPNGFGLPMYGDPETFWWLGPIEPVPAL